MTDDEKLRELDEEIAELSDFEQELERIAGMRATSPRIRQLLGAFNFEIIGKASSYDQMLELLLLRARDFVDQRLAAHARLTRRMEGK